MIQLEVDIQSKRFLSTATTALEGLRLSAAPGEFVGIVGPSGAGKSTLLNIVGGLDRDYGGEVLADARPLLNGSGAAVRIGIVFQSPRLMPWLSVVDNLTLVTGDDPNSAARAHHLIHQIELDGYEHAFPGELSGGMQRRVGLARAFAINPQLLLLDEPFVSLDAPTAGRLRKLLLKLWDDLRPTVLFVTHDLREALALADRVVFLSVRPGRVVLDRTVELPRPRELNDRAVTELHDCLLARHPDLLSGLVHPDNPLKRESV